MPNSYRSTPPSHTSSRSGRSGHSSNGGRQPPRSTPRSSSLNTSESLRVQDWYQQELAGFKNDYERTVANINAETQAGTAKYRQKIEDIDAAADERLQQGLAEIHERSNQRLTDYLAESRDARLANEEKYTRRIAAIGAQHVPYEQFMAERMRAYDEEHGPPQQGPPLDPQEKFRLEDMLRNARRQVPSAQQVRSERVQSINGRTPGRHSQHPSARQSALSRNQPAFSNDRNDSQSRAPSVIRSVTPSSYPSQRRPELSRSSRRPPGW